MNRRASSLESRVARGGRAEPKARALERGYRELFDKSPQPMWVCEHETLRFLAVNNAAIRQYGYSRDEFLKMGLMDLLPGEDVSVRGKEMVKGNDGATYCGEWRLRKKDGTEVCAEMAAERVRFDDRQASLLLSADVTEWKRVEKRVRAFADLGRRLSAAHTQREAAHLLVDTADRLFGWDACAFHLCSPDQKAAEPILRLETVEGARQEVCSPGPAGQASPYTQRAIEQGAQLVLRLGGQAGSARVLRCGNTPASLMVAPVRNQEAVIAVVSIQNCRPRAYTQEDLTAFQGLADHCGDALERIRAEEEILRLNAELEGRVRQRTAQLEAINRELEAFCYSVSHDLRAPLRSIRGFSDVLLERYAGQLDARGQDFLRRSGAASEQMNRLIEDLLGLSRLSRTELRRQPVNLSALAESIAEELRRAEPEREVEFIIAPELTTVGDERLLRVALDNLLRNAWKFTGKTPTARIEFACTTDGEPAFFVRDNGAGFDMAFADRLFGVFQRLHSPSEFPGTGVGLATVQRIIARHGGRTWATGAVNQGASFYFALPTHPE